MAPSGMFSYLRPHHRRTTSASKPTSPLNPSPLYSAESAASSPDFQTHSPLPPRLPRSESPHSNSISPVSPLPPTLPQIPRVASNNDHQGELGPFDRFRSWSAERNTMEETRAASQILRPVSRDSASTGLSPNLAFAVDKNQINGNRPQTARPTVMKDSSGGVSLSRTITAAPPAYNSGSYATAIAAAPPAYSSGSYGTAGPAPANLGSPSLYSNYSFPPNPTSSNRSSTTANSNPIPRSGKNKLNLLNPMSLLMRRRANQTAAYLPESSYSYNRNVTLPVLDDYDPRIRGKGVHDFSVPRARRNIPSPDGEKLSPAIGGGRNLGSPFLDESGRKYSTGQDSRLLRVDVGSGLDGDSPIGPRSGEHTPIFREHFGDEISDDEANSKPHRGQRATGQQGNAGGMERPKVTPAFIPPPDRAPPPPPPQQGNGKSDSEHQADLQLADKEPIVEEITTTTRDAKQWSPGHSGKTELQDLPGSVDSGPVGAALAESPAYYTGLPKHLKSNASRFSFEVSGMGSSSQEKLLEEAHKKTMAKRRTELPKQRQNSFVDEYDERFDEDGMGDYDDFDDGDDGGFEEKIPGVNTDAIEDEYGTGVFEEEIAGVNTDAVDEDHYTGPGIGGFNFGTPATGAVGSSTIPFGSGAGIVGTPRDTEGQPIGFALSKESPMVYQPQQNGQIMPHLESPELGHRDSGDGLGLLGVDTGGSVDEDELYYDDGIIEHPLEDEAHDFDESVFDDESNEIYGLPLRDLKPPKLRESIHLSPTTNSSPAKYTSEDDEEDSIVPQDSQATDTTFPPMMNPSGNGLGYQASLGNQLPPSTLSSQPQSGMGLTQGNLAAYHAALVAAAKDAAVNGKLATRRDSGISGELGGYEAEYPRYDQNSHSMLVPDSGRVSEEAGNHPYSPNGFYDGMDDFDYEDALEDDPIIAEANADALASDDDGFYGSEFGFYAQAAGSGQAQYVAGGYFGPKNEIMRSTSGRMACREPNLTPITERSECSNRNSFALSLHGPPGQAGIASPGLAQLVGMMGGGVEDDDMNLSTLMRLRRGAWGGSNGSLRSAGSGGSQQQQQQAGSPLTYLQPVGPSGSGLATSNVMITGAGGSSLSLASSVGLHSSGGYGSEHGASAPASPTLTMANYTSGASAGRWGTGQPGLRTSGQSEGSSGSNPGSPLALMMSDFHPQQPQPPPASPKKNRHRREGSGGDSIAYLREEDNDGGERWVLERRRTDEHGEVEIVGREIVEGGRI